jgi:positive regulator of sigma E activity
MKEYFQRRSDPNRLLKIGIICIFFGIGLGLGLMLQDYLGRDYYVPFSLFTITGIGFVAANLISKKFESKDLTK